MKTTLKQNQEYPIVRNMRTLRAMESRGLIKLHKQTGTKVKGLYSSATFTCYYISDIGPNADTSDSFRYKNKWYKVVYLSGCFYPYVMVI